MPRNTEPYLRVSKPRRNKKGSYAVGFNGHAKCCTCDACARSYAESVQELWEANGRYARPKSMNETVFVRSYFRRQPNHLAKKPNFAAHLHAVMRGIRKASS